MPKFSFVGGGIAASFLCVFALALARLWTAPGNDARTVLTEPSSLCASQVKLELQDFFLVVCYWRLFAVLVANQIFVDLAKNLLPSNGSWLHRR